MSTAARILAVVSVILFSTAGVLLAGPSVAEDALPHGRALTDASRPLATLSASTLPPLPSEFSQSRVLDEARMAGQRLQVWQVSGLMSAERALARVASSWQGLPDARVLEHRHGSWLVLSRLSSGRLEILQLRAGALRTEGFLSVWGGAPTSGQPPIARLIPQGFRSGSLLQTTEGARRVWSTSAEVDEPIASARQRLDRHLRALDFVPSVLSDEVGDASIVRYVARDRALTVLARGAGPLTQFVLTLSETQP